MGRGYIAAGLHSEISEYSSLLRALQTSGALDIVPHLTRAHAGSSRADNDQDSDVRPSGSESEGGIDFGSKAKRKSNIEERPKSKSTSQGNVLSSKGRRPPTRWPLLPQEIQVPEWGLDDEIKLLALQSLQAHEASATAPQGGHDDDDDDDDDDEEILPPSCLNALTMASSEHLSCIFALLAAHIPLSENSMQGRITPMGWESVLDILSANDACSEKFVWFSYSLYSTNFSPVVLE
jgi:hypothetical protein